jgi:hypothetical protein
LWPATCRAFFGSLGEPLIIIGILAHYPLGFGIVYLLRKSASFLSAVSQCFGSLIEWSDTKLLPNLVGCTPI